VARATLLRGVLTLRLAFPGEAGPVGGSVRVERLARAATRFRAGPASRSS
jgi:hypothetical protein